MLGWLIKIISFKTFKIRIKIMLNKKLISKNEYLSLFLTQKIKYVKTSCAIFLCDLLTHKFWFGLLKLSCPKYYKLNEEQY